MALNGISKDDQKRLMEVQARLQNEAREVEAAFELLTPAIEAVNAAIASYNEVLNEVNGIVEDIASEAESDFNDKSEKWQEGERGQAFSEWMGELQSFSLTEIDPVEAPEPPDELHQYGETESIPNEPSY